MCAAAGSPARVRFTAGDSRGSMSMRQAPQRETRSEPPRRPVEEEILRATRSIRYGSVEVVVHDGRVVAIERREKTRFDRNEEISLE